MDKLGGRLTILMGSVLSTIGFGLSMFATSVEYLTVTAGAIGGLGCCFIQITTIPCITAVFVKYRSVIISSCTLCSALYVTVFPYLYKILVLQYSWRGVFGILACIALNTSVSGMIITSFTFKKPQTTTTIHDACALIDDSGKRSPDKKTDGENIISRKRDETDTINGTQSHTFMNSSCQKTCSFEYSDAKVSLSSEQTPLKLIEKVKRSKWKFLTDSIYIIFLTHNAFCLASIFCFSLFATDFAKTRGFDKSTGILFFTVIFISSVFGRIFAGLLNLSPRFHSINLYTAFSFLGMVVFFVLSFIREYILILVCLCLYGSCLGAAITLQMKCILDIQSVDQVSYPLALGFCCTTEGIADFLMSILIGYSVDVTGSYTLILILMGWVGIVITILLGVGFWYFSIPTPVQSATKDLRPKSSSERGYHGDRY